MSTLDLLLVGPSCRSTGGIAQFLAEQRRQLPPWIDVTVHDDGTRDAETPLTAQSVHSAVGSLQGLAQFPAHDPPDVVHVHASHGLSFHRAGAYILYADSVWDAGVVLHVHGSSFDDFLESESALAGSIQSRVFEACDAVVVLSDYWRDAVADRVPAEKVHVVPNGVDVDDYDPVRIAAERPDETSHETADGNGTGGSADEAVPAVAFVSNHVPRKGIGELVEAVDRLTQGDAPPFEVRIGGDGPISDAAASLADRYESVDYLGYVSEARKRELLAESTIYALPSHAEGLPIALLEGMATGNAVVTTRVGSIPEVVGEGNGRLVDPGDVEQLTDALGWLVANPETARRMGERNHRLVRERYSWDAVVGRLVDIYESVAADATVRTSGDRDTQRA